MLLLRSIVPLLLASAAWTICGQDVMVGDEICVEGFVMDLICIERGTLVDRPDVMSLVNPDLHSMVCLIDVPACVNSSWEVLLDPTSGELNYTRGWRLDDAGKDTVIALGRRLGVCDTCSGDGSLVKGFRVAINGTVADLGNDPIPPTLNVTSASQSVQGEVNQCGFVTMYEVNSFNGTDSGDMNMTGMSPTPSATSAAPLHRGWLLPWVTTTAVGVGGSVVAGLAMMI